MSLVGREVVSVQAANHADVLDTKEAIEEKLAKMLEGPAAHRSHPTRATNVDKPHGGLPQNVSIAVIDEVLW